MSRDKSSSLQHRSFSEADVDWRTMLDSSMPPNVTVSGATPPVPASPPVYATPPATPPCSDAFDSPGRTPTDANATLKDANSKRNRTKSSQSQSQAANPDRFENLTEYMRHLRAVELKAADSSELTPAAVDDPAADDSECDSMSMWSSQSVRGSPAPVARRTFAAAAAASGSSVGLETPEETVMEETSMNSASPPAAVGTVLSTKDGAKEEAKEATVVTTRMEDVPDYFSYKKRK